jgi:hypothetical protein
MGTDDIENPKWSITGCDGLAYIPKPDTVPYSKIKVSLHIPTQTDH